ncbi:MAG TPA: hypothetical protein VK116_13120, partial [Planctomycetota bacterium]|nr:hypothetical protein [Planctomycetota bacterium]
MSRDTWTRLETQDFLLEKSTGELREYDLKIAKEALENERSLVASEGREPPFDVARALEVFKEHGIEGFEAEPFPSEGRSPIIFGRPVWPDGGGRDVMSLGVGWIVLLLWASLLLLSLGAANQDLGKVDWSVEWLFTLPAPAWVIFLARMVEASILNAMGWVIMMPFFSVVYWTAGFGAWGIGLAFLAALSFVTLLAAARILIETWLRTRLAFGALKNAQAAASMAGLLVWFGVFWLVFSPGALGHVAALSASTHDAFLWTPWTIAAVPARLDATAFAAFPAMLLSSALLALAAVKLCERCARHGLIANSGSRRGVRRKDAAQAATRTRSTSRESRLFGGILGKDLKLLLRDRNFFAQTLIVPLVIIGFQVVFNPTILEGAVKDPRHASVLAFGVGAYILCFSGFQILVAEGPALWMLYTLPHDLWRLLLRKAMLWCWLALGYATVVLGLAAGANLEMGADGLATIGVAIAGVLIHAFIAAGLGVLGTDPLEA